VTGTTPTDTGYDYESSCRRTCGTYRRDNADRFIFAVSLCSQCLRYALPAAFPVERNNSIFSTANTCRPSKAGG
jgi:hypothetical protein